MGKSLVEFIMSYDSLNHKREPNPWHAKSTGRRNKSVAKPKTQSPAKRELVTVSANKSCGSSCAKIASLHAKIDALSRH